MNGFFQTGLSMTTALALDIFNQANEAYGGEPSYEQPIPPMPTVTGTTYYVDPTATGTGDGLTEANAMTTSAQIEAKSYVGGDGLLFKCDTTFNDRQITKSLNGTTGNDIIIGSYGTGAKPIIEVMTHFTDLAWTLTGTTNVWQCDTQTGAVFQDYFGRVKRNGVEIFRATTLEELGTVASPTSICEYYFDSATDYLYIYSETSPDADTFDYALEKGVWVFGTSSNVYIWGINFVGSNEYSVNLGNATNFTLGNVSIGDMSRQGLRISAGDGILVDGCLFDTVWSIDYSGLPVEADTIRGPEEGIVTAGTVNNLTVKNSVFINWGHNSVSYTHGGTGTQEISNCYFTAPDIAYGGKNAFSTPTYVMDYSNNTHDNIPSGRTQSVGSTHIHHNIYRNLFTSVLKSSTNRGWGVSVDGTNSLVEDNVFIDCSPGAARSYDSATNATIRNNDIINCTKVVDGRAALDLNSGKGTGITVTGNNVYDSSNTANACRYISTFYTADGYNSAPTQDGDVISGNYVSSNYDLTGKGCDFIDHTGW